LQGFLLQVEVSKIIVHEADEPNAVVDFLDAEFLAGEQLTEIDLLPIGADAAAGRHGDGFVMGDSSCKMPYKVPYK